MHLQINLNGDESPELLARITAALETYAGITRPMATLEDRRFRVLDKAELSALKEAITGDDDDDDDDKTLAKLEAENPQFGRQPLPEGATDGPLAPPSPPSAPSPAAAAPSTSAPAAAMGSSAAPAAPPVPPAPPAAATQPPAPVGEVDKNGLPWDERIHASSRAKIADGSWRMKRGVEPGLVTQVEKELGLERLSALSAVAPAAPPGPPAPPVAPVAPAAPAAPVAGAGLTFGQLAKRVGAKITLGELTAADLAAKMAALGFPGGLHEANARPDMWATILETLGA